MKKILVTGSNGLLGQKVVYGLLEKEDVKIIATARGENRLKRKEGYIYEQLDITDEENVKAIFEKHTPHTIIHTAAMTNVDPCETERELCWKSNVEAVQYIVNECEKHNVHLVHISTDFIFDGEKDDLYTEDDEPMPVSYYGLSKLEGEKVVKNSNIKWAILRTILVYGIVDDMSRSNIVLWAKNSLESSKKINVVDDQWRSPTLAEDLAQGCILAAVNKASGIYNISGKDYMNVIDIVYKVADFYGLDKSLITPVSSSTLSQPAKRPPKTGFILDKAQNDLGYKPHSFEEGLKIVDRQLNYELR
ncbi:MAG: NAD(P)-dependent oxidoreductase [Flavobacteriales bacterium]|nr:MAG: NAD(P)-dependent oxidoreductase [Flavobacteriales bacterium]